MIRDNAAPDQGGVAPSSDSGIDCGITEPGASLGTAMEAVEGNTSISATIDDSIITSDADSLAELRKVDEQLSANAKDVKRSLSTSQADVHNTNSKIASLRAAFEKGGDVENAVPRRKFTSSERKGDWSQEKDKETVRLREDLGKERELRVAYEEKCSALEDEVQALHGKLERQHSEWQAEWERRSHDMRQERDRAVEQLQMNRPSSADSKAVDLQRQIIELKRSISGSTRIESQVSDSTFAQEMSVLHHELQNWVVNNFRKAKTNFSQDDLYSRLEKASPRQVGTLILLYEGFEPAARLVFYQATAMIYMMEVFEDELLFGLPDNPEWPKHVRQAVEGLRPVLGAAAFSKWQAVTLDSIRQSDGMKGFIENAASYVAESICVPLCAVTDSTPSQAMMAPLTAIVKRTINLAHVFRVQRSQYAFALPAAGSAFDPAAMEDDSMDHDYLADRAVLCTAFPMVVKIGDAEGANMHLRNVVVKAKVICDTE